MELSTNSHKPAIRPMRSVLTVPVIVPRFVEKAPSSGADVICLDIEDSVPPAEKVRARTLAAEAIATMPRGPYSLFVRVNGPHTGLMEDDLVGVVRPGLDGVIISKAPDAETIRRIDALLADLEQEQGIEPGTIAIAPLIETALGVMNSLAICTSSPRVTAAVFGAEDLATDMRIQRTREGEEIRWARAQVAVACHAARVIPIDTPDPDYTDLDYLEREMTLARSLGYLGKLCIHPTQVEMANRIFRPSDAEIADAHTTVELFEREGIAKGRAAIPSEGRMIDTPIYERAKRLLQWAEAAGSAE
jgi:citrate lyase subunit beta/citryl-CoA lyase